MIKRGVFFAVRAELLKGQSQMRRGMALLSHWPERKQTAIFCRRIKFDINKVTDINERYQLLQCNSCVPQ
jgi:hypothetical protein